KVGPHRTPRADHDRMVAATAAASYRLFQPRFSSLGDNLRAAGDEQGRFRQWATQLRGRARGGRGLARLFAVHAGGRRTTLSRAVRLRWGGSQVPLLSDYDRMVEDRGQDRDQ